ncbi:MAG: pyridoxamine 5'-phosphate oxidase family protein [Gemmatimonadales bacterium]
MAATREDVLEFMRGHVYGVQASVSAAARPQAAVVGFVVTDAFELFFDTVDTTRKVGNLRRNSAIAFVIGSVADAASRTVQYEGIADEPRGEDLEQLRERYFLRFPDGRSRVGWPGILYLRVRPRWVRYSDFSTTLPDIVEFTFP